MGDQVCKSDRHKSQETLESGGWMVCCRAAPAAGQQMQQAELLRASGTSLASSSVCTSGCAAASAFSTCPASSAWQMSAAVGVTAGATGRASSSLPLAYPLPPQSSSSKSRCTRACSSFWWVQARNGLQCEAEEWSGQRECLQGRQRHAACPHANHTTHALAHMPHSIPQRSSRHPLSWAAPPPLPQFQSRQSAAPPAAAAHSPAVLPPAPSTSCRS